MVELVGESREIVANILGNDFEILREISKIKPIQISVYLELKLSMMILKPGT